MGNYSIIVSNASGTATSSAAAFTLVTADETVTQGSPFSFTVTPNGTGPFTYQWYYQDAIPGATNATYSSKAVSTGVYAVVATNSSGSTTYYFGLTVPIPASVDTPTMPPWALLLLGALLGGVALFHKPNKTYLRGTSVITDRDAFGLR